MSQGDLDAFQSEETATSAPVEARITPPPGKIIPPLAKIDSPSANIDPPQEFSLLRVRQESAGGANGARRVGLIALTLSLVAAIGWLAYLYQRVVPFGRDTTAGTAISEPPRPPPSGTIASPVSQEAPRVADTAATPQSSPQDAAAKPLPGNRPAAPSAGATGPASPESTNSVGTAGSVRIVSGSWTLSTELESAGNASSSSLQLGYELQLQQAGDRVTGAGREVREDGAAVNGRAETPISVAGTIQGNRLTLAFTALGDSHPTQGKFVLLLEDDGAIMRGRFSSTAAQSSGTVEARRVQ